MDPNFLLALGTAAVSALLFFPRMMLGAQDRIAAEKKELNERFARIEYRIEQGEKSVLTLQGLVEIHQSAINHRIDLQDQRIALTLEAILKKIEAMERWLGDIKPPYNPLP